MYAIGTKGETATRQRTLAVGQQVHNIAPADTHQSLSKTQASPALSRDAHENVSCVQYKPASHAVDSGQASPALRGASHF